MAGPSQQRDADAANTISALGLRRAALRGMLASPLIDADEHKALRDELVGELRSMGQTMAKVTARNAVELCAKVDALGEEYRQDFDPSTIQDLVASIRRDVLSLVPSRPAADRPAAGLHPIRTFQARPVESETRPAEPETAASETGTNG